MRFRVRPTAILAGTALVLAACAERLPETAPTAPAAAEAPPPKRRPVARARRPEPSCLHAKPDLPQDRKEALFREFDATLGPTAALPPAALPAPTPTPPATDCRQAAR